MQDGYSGSAEFAELGWTAYSHGHMHSTLKMDVDDELQTASKSPKSHDMLWVPDGNIDVVLATDELFLQSP